MPMAVDINLFVIYFFSNHKSPPAGMLPKNSPKWPQGRHPEAKCESPFTPTYENPAFEPPVMTVVPRVNPETPQAVESENPYALVSDIPLDLSALSVTEVSDILKNLNMGQYAESFEDEMIDGSLLKELKDSDLQSFQMTTIHRTKLLNFIKGWRPRLNRN